MTTEQALFLARFLVPAVCGVVAAVEDVRRHRIPNLLSVPLLAGGLLFRGASGGWSGLGDSAAGFAVGFGILFVMWLIGGAGGGDVKFMAAVGAWLGPYNLIVVFVLSAVVAAILSLGLLWNRRRSDRTPKPGKKLRKADREPGAWRRVGVPYALPATVAVFLRMAWLWFIHRTS